MYDPNHDRTYWRACTDKRLIEAAQDSGHELAIALGERLAETNDRDALFEEYETELSDLRSQINYLRAELNAYETADE